MRRRVLLLPLALLLLPLPLGRGPRGQAVAAPDYVGIEAAIAAEKRRAAKAWLDLASDLAGMDLKAEADDALRRAVAADADVPDRERVGQRVRATSGAGVASPKSAKRVERARKDVAACYDRMAAVLAKEQQDSRYAEWLVIAANLEPTKARVQVLGAMAQAAPLLVRPLDQPFSAYVSLPATWKPGGSHPTAVCLEADALKFKQRLALFQEQRGTTGWILVTPLTFSPGAHLPFDLFYPAYSQKLVESNNKRRVEFDLEGLGPLLETVQRLFGAEPDVALSAHGTAAELALRVLLQGTFRVRAAVLVAPRYDAAVLQGISAVADGGGAVTLLGASDDAAVTGAREALVAAGWTRVEARPASGDPSTGLVADAWAVLSGAAVR